MRDRPCPLVVANMHAAHARQQVGHVVEPQRIDLWSNQELPVGEVFHAREKLAQPRHIARSVHHRLRKLHGELTQRHVDAQRTLLTGPECQRLRRIPDLPQSHTLRVTRCEACAIPAERIAARRQSR